MKSQKAQNQYLSVKLLTLQAEARIIKAKEAKWRAAARSALVRQKQQAADSNYNVFWGLKLHRIRVVRPHARACNIAQAFLRGKKYVEVERTIDPTRYAFCGITHNQLWDMVANNVTTFGVKYAKNKEEAKKDLAAWRGEHPAYQEKVKRPSIRGEMWYLPKLHLYEHHL